MVENAEKGSSEPLLPEPSLDKARLPLPTQEGAAALAITADRVVRAFVWREEEARGLMGLLLGWGGRLLREAKLVLINPVVLNDEKGRERRADMAFSFSHVALGEEPGLLSIEHSSEAQEEMFWRQLGYGGDGGLILLKRGWHPRVVVLPVLYTGRQEWVLPSCSYGERGPLEVADGKRFFFMQHEVIDGRRIPAATLMAMNTVLGVWLLLLKPWHKDATQWTEFVKEWLIRRHSTHGDVRGVVHMLRGYIDAALELWLQDGVQFWDEVYERIPNMDALQVFHENLPTTMAALEARGRAEGLALGQADYARKVVRRSLLKREGTLPANIEERLKAASLAELQDWDDRIEHGAKIEEIFPRP